MIKKVKNHQNPHKDRGITHETPDQETIKVEPDQSMTPEEIYMRFAGGNTNIQTFQPIFTVSDETTDPFTEFDKLDRVEKKAYSIQLRQSVKAHREKLEKIRKDRIKIEEQIAKEKEAEAAKAEQKTDVSASPKDS